MKDVTVLHLWRERREEVLPDGEEHVAREARATDHHRAVDASPTSAADCGVR